MANEGNIMGDSNVMGGGGSTTTGATEEYTIVDHGVETTINLTTADLNKVHILENVAACTITLPSVSSSQDGHWIEFQKRAAGNVIINRADADTIGDGTATSVSNLQAADTYHHIRLMFENGTNWAFSKVFGSWT